MAEEVDVVFADTAAVPELDGIEAEAITGVFGPGGVAVTAPKTMTGRLYSGGGPLDLVAALLSIRDHVLPPTINVTVAPQYEIDLVIDTPRKAVADVALVIARGHGGFNSAVILRGTH